MELFLKELGCKEEQRPWAQVERHEGAQRGLLAPHPHCSAPTDPSLLMKPYSASAGGWPLAAGACEGQAGHAGELTILTGEPRTVACRSWIVNILASYSCDRTALWHILHSLLEVPSGIVRTAVTSLANTALALFSSLFSFPTPLPVLPGITFQTTCTQIFVLGLLVEEPERAVKAMKGTRDKRWF